MSVFDSVNKRFSSFKKTNVKIKASNKFVSTYNSMESGSIVKSKIGSSGGGPYKSGLLKMKAKDFDSAAELFKKALRVKPDSIKARLYLSQCYIELEEFSKAVAGLKDILLEDSKHSEARKQLGIAYFKQDKMKLAIKEFKKALTFGDKNDSIKKKLANTYYVLGNRCRKDGDGEEAISNYTKALDNDKSNPTVMLALGVCYKELLDDDTSIEYLNNALKLFKKKAKNDSKISNIYIHLAEIQQRGEEPEEAIESYKKAIEIDPHNIEAQFHLGELFFNHHEYELALKCYIKTVKVDPSYVQAFLNLAQTYVILEDLDKALIAYEKVLEIDEENPTALANIALITYKEGNTQDAYRKLLRLSNKGAKNNPLVHKYLGIILVEKGDLDEAIERFMKSIDLNPHDPDTYINLGVCFHKMDNLERAVEEYVNAIEIDPSNLIALKNLALLYYETQKISKCINIYERILEVDPKGSKSVNKTLGHAYRKGEQYKKAIKAYDNYLDNVDENDIDVVYSIGICYYKIGKLIRAIEVFNELKTMNKKYIPVSECYLSKVYEKNGQLKKALDIISKSVQKNPNYIDNVIQYGRICLKNGDINKSIELFERILTRLDPKNKEAKKYLKKINQDYE